MLQNANILKMKQKCILPTSSSAWCIQTPLQRTQQFFFCTSLKLLKKIIFCVITYQVIHQFFFKL